MTSPHWPLLCDPAEKAAREADNSVSQIEYIEYAVNTLHATEIREHHVLEFQQLAIAGLYPCGGRYRSATQDVSIQNSNHTLPEPALIRGLVIDAIETLNAKRGTWSSVRRAAYALWRFNWIHPFAGGNGRMSRALAYMLVCMDHGAMLPGVPSMPHIIARQRDRYIQVLQAADAGAALSSDGSPDLEPMVAFLEAALSEQLTIVIRASGATTTSGRGTLTRTVSESSDSNDDPA